MTKIRRILVSIILFTVVIINSFAINRDEIFMMLKTFDTQTVENIIPKTDALIATAKDSTEASFIAGAIFDYYRTSPIMGYDAIAVYIADTYFINKKLEYPNDESAITIPIFAKYNRNSLIGMRAPELNLPDSLGQYHSLSSTSGKYKIIYFFDTDCAICKIETPKLMRYLSKEFNNQNNNADNFTQLTIYRVYTQDHRDKWTSYIKRKDISPELPLNINIIDVWDPAFVSNFPELYSVLSTPRMFLLDEQNTIIGRNLNTDALSKLISKYEERPNEMFSFYDRIFKQILPKNPNEAADSTLLTSLIDAFYQNSQSNTKLTKDVMLGLYQYLKTSPNYDLQKGAAYLGKTYILAKPKLWNNEKFLHETAIAINLFYRNPLGKPAQNITLNKMPAHPNFFTNLLNKEYSIYDSHSEYTVLYFYNLDCALCEAVTLDIKKTYELFKKEDINFLAINTGTNKKEWRKHVEKDLFSGRDNPHWINLMDAKRKSDMFQKYNLSGVPLIMLLDQDKTTIAKDITPSVLQKLLKDSNKN